MAVSMLSRVGSIGRMLAGSPSGLNADVKRRINMPIDVGAVGVSIDVAQHLGRYKEHTENIKSAIESMIISSKRSLAEQRQNCLHIILATVDKIKDWAESEVRPLTDNFRSSQDALLIEMRKLGVNTN